MWWFLLPWCLEQIGVIAWDSVIHQKIGLKMLHGIDLNTTFFNIYTKCSFIISQTQIKQSGPHKLKERRRDFERRVAEEKDMG